jgi:WD40 repeat protein/tetratricopeptide (TPR) repeat protein/predicted Ser/Thr protein kinase
MAHSRTCPKCGAVHAGDAIDGLCPRCVLAVVMEPPVQTASPSADAPSRPGAARSFGNYELLEEIGRGGMGVIYKARQAGLDRFVAVKMILGGHFASRESVRRFQAEAQTAARLRHPNIVALHEVGQHEGRHFFSMDFVEGRNLTDLVRDKPLATARAARYVQLTAEAIHHAHEQGILHRDLKPSNILIDDADQPRVTDFGLAKQLHSDSSLTLTGQVLGSPNYMPPEQAGGRHGDVGPWSDVYALGAILYQLLTGRGPFLADTVEQTLAQVLHNEPASPRVLNPALPRDLETICLKCLEKDSRRRYRSARELADELQRFLNHEPIRARSVSSLEKGWRWCRRKPALAGLGAALALAVVLGFAGVLWQWGRAERHALSENIERGRAELALGELELERAEDLLRNDQPNAALAWLAHSIRRQPTNAVVAQRIVSVLNERNFALRSAPPFQHTGAVAWAEFSPDGTRVVTASHDGTAQVWDAPSGRPAVRALRHEGARVARFSPDGRLVATGGTNYLAQLWLGKEGSPVGPPLVHDGAVAFLEFSADGRRLLTVAKDRRVRIWEVPEGRLLFRTAVHGATVEASHFSPDGRRFLTATMSGAIRVWDSATGAPVTPELKQQTLHLFSARFSPAGDRVVCAGDSPHRATVRDIQTGRVLGEIRQHDNTVEDAVFSPDGHWLVTVSRDGTARVWDAHTFAARGVPLPHRSWVLSAEFSPDGQRLLTTSLDHTAHVWDLIRWRPLTEPVHPGGNILHARFSPDGARLVTASQSGAAQVWDVRPGRAVAGVLPHGSSVVRARFSHDGRRVATGAGAAARVWNAATAEPLTSLLRHQNGILDIAFSPDDQRIVTTSYDNTSAVWDTQTGRRLARWTNQMARVFNAQFSPDGRRILTASFDRTVWVWDAATAQPVVGPLEHNGRVWHAEFSPDGQRIVAGAGRVGESGQVAVWDAQTGRPLFEHPHSDETLWVSFSPDGANIVSASADHTACILDVPSGRLRHTLAHEAMVTRAVFSPDGGAIATACRDQSARLWHAASGAPLTPPLRHADEIVAVRFSQDGRRLATASLDQTARVWDRATGKLLAGPFWHTDQVRDVDFSPDGRWIATASYDDTARLWELPALPDAAPRWLATLAESAGGLVLDGRNNYQPTPGGRFSEVERAVEGEVAPDPLGAWARWFLSDRSTRAISPSSPVRVSDFAQRRARGDTPAALMEALEFEPTNALALARLARWWLKPGASASTNAVADAARLLDWAVRRSPNEFEAWWGRAELLERNGDANGAADAMDRARALDPRHFDFWMSDGALLERLGRLDAACESFSKALTNSGPLREPPSVAQTQALLRRGAALQAAGRLAEATRDFLLARNIPSRAPDTSTNCVDLSLWYGAPLHKNWHTPPEMGSWNLGRLPPGRHTFGGVEFDVRGIIQLSSPKIAAAFPDYPREVHDLSVGRRCRALHFLHASIWAYALPSGTRIGAYLVRYSDGLREEIPIVHGEDLLEWQVLSDPVEELKRARVAWTGKLPHGRPVRLFKRTWENPRPDATIASFDFLSEMTDAAPFLIAVSVEP